MPRRPLRNARLTGHHPVFGEIGMGPKLLQGCEEMIQRAEKIPKTGGAERLIPQAIDRLIELYTLTNKPDEAKKWQAERAKYPEAKQQPETQ